MFVPVARAQLAGENGSSEYQPDRKLPWRDYSSSLLAAPDALVTAPYERHGVIISARNTLNEWGYQLRLGHDWIRQVTTIAPSTLNGRLLQFGGDGTSTSFASVRLQTKQISLPVFRWLSPGSPAIVRSWWLHALT